jgi:hypothetical protein
MSIQEITHRLEACKRECVFYQEHKKQFQWKHFKHWKQIAQDQEDKEAFNKISAIIQQEQQCKFWHKLNYVTGKKKMRSATSIQVKGQDGTIMEHTTQYAVEQTIFSKVHEKQYTLAGKASICNGELFQHFGYTANTPASKAVLDETYVAPSDSDAATKEPFAKIAAIRRLVPANSVSTVINPGQ